MRLSDVLSKPQQTDTFQVENFLGMRKIPCGKHRNIKVGKVAINYFCKACNEFRTYYSKDELACLIVAEHIVSIDCVLTCPSCNSSLSVWFLIGCDKDFFSQAPLVYIIQCDEEISEAVSHRSEDETLFPDLFDKADRAYGDQLGAGSIIYLRKIYEQIVISSAQAAGIPTNRKNGKPRSFRELLQEVDQKINIIPQEFSADGYRLFGDLSNIIHGDYDEEEALQKYEPFQKLVKVTAGNMKNRPEVLDALKRLWNDGTAVCSNGVSL